MHENPVTGIRLEAWGTTDVGMKRRLNEDVFLVDESAGVFLVADGMGGHAAGEVASELAAKKIIGSLTARPYEAGETWPEHWTTDRSATGNLIVDAVLDAHTGVTEAVVADPNLKGMGTTVVVATHQDGSDKIAICHVGDSRAYRLRGGTLTLLTNDHSWVHEQVAAGMLTEDSARSHPLKNVVTQALGGSAEPQPDVLELVIEEGDLFLLCSDGLNTMLSDQQIEGILDEDASLKEIADHLVVAANEQGGNDNVSVVVLRAVPIP
ncbi:MAG: protein phosphatase 2C domain-containing protein [Thermoanaerobaculales bacterium]|nr:protein phosphatase 2C domain-containing protein [Thermoanaerobaculales bacterium]